MPTAFLRPPIAFKGRPLSSFIVRVLSDKEMAEIIKLRTEIAAAPRFKQPALIARVIAIMTGWRPSDILDLEIAEVEAIGAAIERAYATSEANLFRGGRA
ncbi:MAG: hypothetical protein J0I79_19925 [Mesorhizobium sp.]|uniref:hypothetical protein n=1 Tax=Mesorhizobium sp. TaxID=1871066 RepID=UPI001AC6D4BF|nr:hypothetical protein [Mesorhizobium sp.]MBN9220219.1 hypothetical protein [Mesorhizobium sp.]